MAEDRLVLVPGTAKQVVFYLLQAEWIRPALMWNSWTVKVGIEELKALSKY